MNKHAISTGILLFGLYAPMALLAYDGDSSGVSDVYEDLHGRTLPADEDADLDGYSNYLESLFGSDPLDSADPGNFNFSVFADSASMSVPNQVGLRYRVESSLTLAVDSWQPIGDFQVSDGLSGLAEFDVSGISAAFFRVELAPPLNSDSDGLNDWEEAQLGTDPLLSDTDNDLLDDDVETMIAGSNPHKVDSDGDGFVDKDEYDSGSDPDDATAWPPIITSNAWSRPMVVRNEALAGSDLLEAWSAPMVVRNEALAGPNLSEAWSAPMTVRNEALAGPDLSEAWSAPMVVRNEALAGPELSEAWSAPIVVRNEALAGPNLSEAWSAPILVLNTYTEPTS